MNIWLDFRKHMRALDQYNRRFVENLEKVGGVVPVIGQTSDTYITKHFGTFTKDWDLMTVCYKDPLKKITFTIE